MRSERTSLVALLDAQRRELEMREKAQQDAMQVAAHFAAAIQSFEERLVAVEASTSHELASIRELLQRQSAATDLILQSLGVAHLVPALQLQPPPPPAVAAPTAAASSSLAVEASNLSPLSSPSAATQRRETN
ncbi:hypothetical protein PybrP1_005283 [[Pythium] brassicae (nom. inval.)]|nr:hypothetical protein PybrP1_005283 [[Pythium] brassicae (nom. inval.)]